MKIELCYATPTKQVIEAFLLPEGLTLGEALERISVKHFFERNFPEMSQESLTSPTFGIFSKPQPVEYVLKNHDRIEIYRPLTIDPMQKRVIRHQNHPLKGIPR